MSYITESLRNRVVAYTDAGTWKASWHWDRRNNGSITLEGAKQMLADLGCDKCEGEEILMAVQHIRERYKLADELRETIRGMERDMIGIEPSFLAGTDEDVADAEAGITDAERRP